MKNVRHFLPACALVLAIAAPASAATVLSALEEIIVTATRRPATADDISTSLSLISGDEVRSEKLTTDALSSQIGVFLQQTTPGQGAAIIRGLKGSAILHLVDGMPLSNAIFRSAPTPYLAYVPTTAVERIEVVRGTPASLYGSQAVGGVVQVVSRVPDFDTDQLEWARDVALTLDTAELQKSIKGTIDAGTSRLAASLSAEYLMTGDRMTGGGARVPLSGYESRAARLVVSATPDNNKTWLFDLHLLEQPKTPRVDELIPGFGQVEPSSSEFYFAPSQRTFAHVEHTSNDALFDLDWGFDAAWQRVVDDRVTRDFESTTRRYEDNRSDLFAVSVNAADSTDVLSWIIGTDIQTDEVRSDRFQEDILTATTTEIQARFPDGSRIDQAALYSNIEWVLADRHSLNAGLRVSDVRIEVPETPLTELTSIDIRRLSGDIGWIFDINDSWQLVTNAGFGFRAPNISDMGTLGNRPGNRFNVPNTDLKEEQVQQFDIGFRQSSDRHRIEFVFYRLEFDDRITSVLTGDITAEGRDIVTSVNATKSSIHGAESGVDLELSDRLRVHAVLNYTWGRETVGSEAQPADRIPPLSGNLDLQIDLNATWTLDTWLTVAGKQDRLSDRDIRDVRINPDGTAGWAILGTRASWTPNSNWQIDLAANNLLDKRYRVHGSGVDEPGRNFSISLRANW